MKLLVFLHGLGQMPQTWQDQITAMPSDEFKAVAPWLKGLRPGRLSDFELDAASDDVLGLLNVNGVDAVALVGTGLGGLVALNAAQRCPECVSDLVVSGVTLSYGRLALGAQRALIKALPESRWAATGLNRGSVLGVMDALAGLDLSHTLGRVTARTLALVGAQDRGHRASAEQVARGVAEGKLATIADAADPLHLTNPAGFNAELWGFLRS